MSSNYQLVTPPSSVELSKEVPQPETKVDLKNYIRNATILILSNWKDCKIKPMEFSKFLKEILTRSRCSINILQIAIFYLFKLEGKIKKGSIHLQCPKKVFLICLILSFKFNLDSNYKLLSWSKMSGLSINELNLYETKILIDLNYNLNEINKPGIFNAWCNFLNNEKFNEYSLKRSHEPVNVLPKRVKV